MAASPHAAGSLTQATKASSFSPTILILIFGSGELFSLFNLVIFPEQPEDNEVYPSFPGRRPSSCLRLLFRLYVYPRECTRGSTEDPLFPT
eukprot:CAMPEP_0196585422 /NCGR_PEP_ID=MMETSP1081-20130531/50591_1 /TAXON_ID=36882 /ORGANISM="Pyramimonas amylifera, Strain CCMP720" /LENGTH=90 /DNA_ID=CAMNT_0041906957 /DNA_START=810 /DNA_END=1082 /DNA_ORIENTATION=-